MPFIGDTGQLSNIYEKNYETATLRIVEGDTAFQAYNPADSHYKLITNLQEISEIGAVTDRTIQFTNVTTSFTTTSNAGISNTNPVHTLDIGSNVQIDDVGSNTFWTSGTVYATNYVGETATVTNSVTTRDVLIDRVFPKTNGFVQMTSNVGILNTAPIHTLDIGANVQIDEYGSNTFWTSGNVYSEHFKSSNVTVSGTVDTDKITVNDINSKDTDFVNFTSNVGILNTAPIHTLDIGANVQIDEYGSNTFWTSGNVYSEHFKSSNITVSGTIDTDEVIINHVNAKSTDFVNFTSNVGVLNTAPIHTLDIGANVQIDEYGSNTFWTSGNVHANLYTGSEIQLSGVIRATDFILTGGSEATPTPDLQTISEVLASGGGVPFSSDRTLTLSNVTTALDASVIQSITTKSNVIGNNVTAVTVNSNLIGNNVTAVTVNSNLIGNNVTAVTVNSNLIGNNVTAVTVNSNLIGNNVTAVTVNSNLIGNNVTAVTVNSNLIGNNVTAVTVNSNVIAGNVTVDNNLIVNTDDLVVDTVNSRVGINKASPAKDLDVTGEIECSSHLTVGGDISGNGDAVFRKYTIASPGSGQYSVIGPGFDTATVNPTLTLMRGQKYVFDNTVDNNGHPLEIRDGNGGSAYTDGVSGGGTATITFTVPMDAPIKLYYQCINHPAMGNIIYIPLDSIDTTMALNLSNNLVVNTDDLVVDTVNSKVGINKASPTKDLDVTGEIECSSHLTVGGDISGNGDAVFRKYTIAGAGSGEYSVIGPGFDTAAVNPTLTLMRGQKYVFDNTVHHSSHPLEIRDGYQGSAYASGVSGDGTATITFTVPMDAPIKLYYQCTYHPAMGNTIYIPLENLDTSQTLNLSNDLVVGTDKLVVDVSESRVGINNASPSKDLDVIGEIACSSHLTVGGNFTVNGTTTTVNTTSLRVEDTLIELGKNNTAGTSDLGLILKRPTGVGLKSNVAIVYSESVDTLKFGHTLSGSDATPVVFDTSNALAMSLNGSFVATGTVRGSSSLTPGSYLTGSAYDGGSNQTFTVDATDANTAGKVVARDGSGNFSAGTITASMSTSLTPGSYLSGSAYNGGTARTFDVDATDANTGGTVVARDGSGNFSAGTITAALSGNATTAAALQTARAINGVNFDGSVDITVNGTNYDVNDSWLRENGDDAHFKQYGNSRQMVFRTDGTTQYASDVGAYPFAWMYGGDASSNRRMLLNTSGQLWCSNYGWLHDKFMARTQTFTDDVANTTFTGQTIDHNCSGSDACTADRAHRALLIDVDSSATGGGTNHEHRLYGIYNDVRHTGDSDLVYGMYSYTRSDHASGTTTNLRAGDFIAIASGAGTNTNIYGLSAYALKDSGSPGTTANMYGVRGEVEVDAGTCTNAYAFQSHIDRDSGTITTGYLYYGSYSGTVGTKYGVYVTGETKNYFSGNVGIGLTGITEKLHVSGNILATGDVTAYSDKRVKTDISKIKDPLNKVCSINGYTYKRTDTDDDKTHTGVLAQEVMEVLPEVVHGSEDTTYSVAYGNMVGLLIEAIKELKLEIDELKKSR